MPTLLVDAGPMVHFETTMSHPSNAPIEESISAGGLAILIEDGLIAKIQSSQEVREEYSYHGNEPILLDDLNIQSLGGKAVIPGLIDSHSHLVWAGDRSQEVRWRQEGKTYTEISQMGGGISHTTSATRATTKDELYRLGYSRMRSALRSGTTHMEVKSGYGLDTETELKLIEVGHMLGEIQHLPTTDCTWLGAHDVPSHLSMDEYVEELLSQQLPAVAEQGLARSADVFCEPGWFSVEHSEVLLKESRASGLSLRMHIDEFSNGGGGDLAAELKVDTADHSYHTPMDTRLDMQQAGVITGFLPGTPYAMGDAWPSMNAMVEHGIDFTLATDFNPNCQTLSLPFMGSLMVQRCGMNPLDALFAVTAQAARSTPHPSGNLHGRLSVGAVANFNVLDSPHWESWALQPSHTPFHSTVLEGKVLIH
ncbi:imidazolonepropionase [Poseidonia sp.]|uniref:imidazolonepropionase n=1 Tax=Poseidonia sp. TaxID=2666344 RepID=UPI003F6A3E6B